jgi:hypothetical protein
MNFLKFILIAILVVSFTACDKADEIINSNTVKLTKKTWTFNSLSGFDDSTNQFASILFTGMTYRFNTDGNYIAVILTVSGNGKWEFNNDETVIALDSGTAEEVDWTIITLSDTELTISIPDTDALNGIFTMTFK